VSNSPKDNPDGSVSDVKPMNAPKGLDIHPTPRISIHISKRVAAVIGAGTIGILLVLAYGAYRREIRNQVQALDAGMPKAVTPATASAKEVEKDVPVGNAPLVRNDPNRLQPPMDGHLTGAVPGQQTPTSSCGYDPRTGQPYRFSPETGQSCSGYPQDRVVVRQPAYSNPQSVPRVAEPTPEERRIAAAYQREREAMTAPTGIRSVAGGASFGTFPVAQPNQGGDDLARIAALTQTIAGRDSAPVTPSASSRVASPSAGVSADDPDYDAQNNQNTKAAFLASSQQKSDDYLKSTRTPPLSPYAMKAGWEIPAVLEQSLDSDLPGEIKALVTSNVFDTATGGYLLIPQGSRLIGKYDSRISYGQDGVQVVWNRIIFPDASSVDIDGMAGLDSHGNSGLRFDVDHHYKRLLGFTALTSAFSAAFDLSQRSTQSALAYPSAGSTAGASVGRDLSETGVTLTRRNLNVQPTIKVPAGYKFTVRVNRDILFDAPYAPVQANPLPTDSPSQLHPRVGLSGSGGAPHR
jgi:type IV secretion system protein VirB10